MSQSAKWQRVADNVRVRRGARVVASTSDDESVDDDAPDSLPPAPAPARDTDFEENIASLEPSPRRTARAPPVDLTGSDDDAAAASRSGTRSSTVAGAADDDDDEHSASGSERREALIRRLFDELPAEQSLGLGRIDDDDDADGGSAAPPLAVPAAPPLSAVAQGAVDALATFARPGGGVGILTRNDAQKVASALRLAQMLAHPDGHEFMLVSELIKGAGQGRYTREHREETLVWPVIELAANHAFEPGGRGLTENLRTGEPGFTCAFRVQPNPVRPTPQGAPYLPYTYALVAVQRAGTTMKPAQLVDRSTDYFSSSSAKHGQPNTTQIVLYDAPNLLCVGDLFFMSTRSIPAIANGSVMPADDGEMARRFARLGDSLVPQATKAYNPGAVYDAMWWDRQHDERTTSDKRADRLKTVYVDIIVPPAMRPERGRFDRAVDALLRIVVETQQLEAIWAAVLTRGVIVV